MYRRMRLTYKVFWSILFTFALLYDYAMVFLVIKVYTVSFWSLSYWIVEFPFALAITLLFTFANLVHIIIGGSCIQTRQQYICQNFSQLLTKLLLQQRPSVRRFKRISFQYRTFNHSVLSICQQLQAFNSFYTHYLSLIFTEYNVMQGLFAYPVFFASSSQSGIFMLKWLFSVTLFEMIVFLFGIIQFCARVVKKNGQVTRMNRQFAVHCLRNQQLYRLPTQQLLKLELLQWPRLLPFYAFKLFDNTRITSQTFYVMAGNISGFFFFVAQNIQ